MRLRFHSIASAAALIVASASIFQGCGAQTEAMRCEVAGDCESGLTCTNVGFADKICCPERSRATTSECKNGATTVTDTGVDTAPAADTGTPEVATDTAPADTTPSETAADTGSMMDVADAG